MEAVVLDDLTYSTGNNNKHLSMQVQDDDVNSPPRFDFRQMQVQIEAS